MTLLYALFAGNLALVLGCYLDARARLHRLEKWRLEEQRAQTGVMRGRRKGAM